MICDTCQRTKFSIEKYGKLPDKLAEETPWNEIGVDTIFPYRIHRKGKEPLILKSVTVILPVTGWFGKTKYVDKKAMNIENLVETTWLIRYPWPVEITYDQGR